MPAMGQREMRGTVGDRKGGGGDEIHRVGDRHDRVGVDDDLVGIAAAKAQYRKRPLAGPQMPHVAADLDHLAGRFEAGGERELGLHLVLAGDHQRVGKIDAAGPHPEARLLRLQGRGGNLGEPKRLGSAPFAALNRFHLMLLGNSAGGQPRRAPRFRA